MRLDCKKQKNRLTVAVVYSFTQRKEVLPPLNSPDLAAKSLVFTSGSPIPPILGAYRFFVTSLPRAASIKLFNSDWIFYYQIFAVKEGARLPLWAKPLSFPLNPSQGHRHLLPLKVKPYFANWYGEKNRIKVYLEDEEEEIEGRMHTFFFGFTENEHPRKKPAPVVSVSPGTVPPPPPGLSPHLPSGPPCPSPKLHFVPTESPWFNSFGEFTHEGCIEVCFVNSTATLGDYQTCRAISVQPLLVPLPVSLSVRFNFSYKEKTGGVKRSKTYQQDLW
jgi:hypothetical protein